MSDITIPPTPLGPSSSGTGGGSNVLSTLLGSASVANPWMAAAGVLGGAVKPATSSADGNTFSTSNDNSGWNVNFGSGSITSSATREAASQWIGIAAGVVTILVALKVLKG